MSSSDQRIETWRRLFADQQSSFGCQLAGDETVVDLSWFGIPS